LACAAEVVGGILAHSLALLTDAAHLLSDLSGYCIGLFALWAVSLEANQKHSFGYHRVEILGALLSILVIWAVTGMLVVEAVDRMMHPVEVDGFMMFCVATFGLVINLVLLSVLGAHGHSHGGGGGHGHSHGDPGHGHSHGGGRSSNSNSVSVRNNSSRFLDDAAAAADEPVSPPAHLRGHTCTALEECSSPAHRHDNSNHSSNNSHGHGQQQRGEGGAEEQSHGHSHGGSDNSNHNDSQHGHSHGGGSDSEGNSNAQHGHAHGGSNNNNANQNNAEHGHAHGGNNNTQHGHSHGGDDNHSDAEHDHSHGSSDSGASRGQRSHSHGSGGHAPSQHAHSHGSGGGGGGATGGANGSQHGHSHGGGGGGESARLMRAGEGAPPREPGMLESLGSVFGLGNTEESINVRAAALHVVGDLVQSIGVIIASVLIWINPKWSFADPICTLVFAVLVLITTWHMLREVFDVLMERTPRGVNIAEVEEAMLEIEGVVDVHCLHVWALTSGKYLASAHVQVEQGTNETVLRYVEEVLYSRLGSAVHTTFQVSSRPICCESQALGRVNSV